MKLSPNKKAIGCKWMYAKKEGSYDVVDVHYKIRLVAKDFAQCQGINYDEIFFLIIKYSSIRILLAFVAYYSLILE